MRTKIKRAILCGSGKGGVSKSTSATLIALELKRRGYKVALVDSDISGPSLPKITGTKGILSGGPKEGVVTPTTVDGIPILSIELFMNDKGTAILWKGDKIGEYINNTLENVNFGYDIDYMVIDLPPGFSDAVQTPMEFVKEHKIPSGMVFVSTPQAVSVNDTQKAIHAVRKIGIPIIGLIESMKSYICPNCKTEHKIFGEGVVKPTCEKEKIQYLGSIPLVTELSEVSDISLNIKTIPSLVKTPIINITDKILKFFGE